MAPGKSGSAPANRLMSAVIISAPGVARLEETARWPLECGEALIACRAAAICTVERQLFRGLRNAYPGSRNRGRDRHRDNGSDASGANQTTRRQSDRH